MEQTHIGFLGIDQHNTKYILNDKKFPRKQLLEELCATNASKMYIDTKSGAGKHIGYIIHKLWIRLYKVYEWNGKT